MQLPKFNQRGVISLLTLISILLLIVGSVFVADRINKKQFDFSRADTGTLPSADACNSKNEDEKHLDRSKLKNPGFDGAFNNGVPQDWTKFVLSGNPTFNEETGNEKFDRASLRIEGDNGFVAGVYQTVGGLEAGKYYHAFFATAQQVDGEKAVGALPNIREIGVDPTGGTDPTKVNDWGIRKSGGQADKDAGRYGGWKTMGNRNNPLATFKATGSKATIFVKTTSASNAARSKTWLDSVFLIEDCNSGQTVSVGTGSGTGSGSGGATSGSGATSTGTAPACDKSKLKMSIEPVGPRVGDTITLNLQDLGQGTTKIQDGLIGLDCKDLFKLPAAADSWPNVPKYKSCTVKSGDFSWVHKWQNCPPNDTSCSNPSPVCSKTFDKNGEEVTPATTTGNTGGQIQPADLQKAILDQFGINMLGFDQKRLQWAYSKFSNASNTKFASLVKGVNIKVGGLRDAGFYGQPYDCREIVIPQLDDQVQFSLVITHELGHVIDFCNDDPISLRNKHIDVLQKEGGITNYGQTGCGTGFPPAEDYAEMIAYYLNPGAPDKYRPNGCSDGRIPTPEKYPLHYDLAKMILSK